LLKGWDERAAIRAHLSQQIPLARERAMVPARIIARLSAGETLDAAWAGATGSGS
jgi:hypothetical protein